MKVASEWIADNTNTIGVFGTDVYSSSKLMMGSKFSLASGSNYVSPVNAQCRIGELAVNAFGSPFVHEYSSRYNWVFLFDQSAAAVTRRIALVEHDKTLDTLTYKGFITATWVNVLGNKTIRGGRTMFKTASNGTVAVTGTSLTGTDTTFQSNGFSQGARIGFGSTDPAQISNWYEISSIGSDTAVTLSTSPGTIVGGTSYVIEELWFALCITNATATNGGLFLIKGINYNTFNLSGTSIAESTLAGDNRRAIYWIKDNGVPTNQIGAGLALDTQTATGSRNLYFLNADTTARARMYKFNIYQSLSGSLSGSPGPLWSASPFVARTEQATLAASHVIYQANNLKVFTVDHGPASGSSSLWFVSNFTSTSRLNRAPTTGIASGSTTWVSDSMVEIPPGGTGTFPLSNALGQADYSDAIDRIVVATTSAPYKVYVTNYHTDGSQWAVSCFSDTGALNSATTDSTASLYPTPRGGGFSVWTESGYIYLLSTSTTTTGVNVLYALPLTADWNFSDYTNEYVITPKIATSNASKLYKAYVNLAQLDNTNFGYSISSEPVAVYVRTSGIDDNSGSWTLLNANGDLSGISASSYIQFKIKFKLLGLMGVAAKLYDISIVYENDSQDSHYQPSLTLSSTANRYFAWRQVATWGGAVPNMRVRLYDADTDSVILNDTISGSEYGTWSYSLNSGTSWNSWISGSDMVGSYLRYTAGSIPNNMTLRVLLTQV